MARWLLTQEPRFRRYRGPEEDKTTEVSVLLRLIRILDNKRLFGSSEITVNCIVVDGRPDIESGTPFWSQQLRFVNVKDGETLSIDESLGWLIYHGAPSDFMNVYLVVMRNTDSTRQFVQILKDNFVSEGIGIIVAGASIFSGHGVTNVIKTRKIVTNAVDSTLDYFIKRKDPLIGIYYGSLLRQDDYSVGLHPPTFPDKTLKCGNTMEIAYQVKKA